MENKVLIQQGAEAKLYRLTYNHNNVLKQAVLKERVTKSYRHPDLDKKISKERIQLNMQTALKYGLNVPEVYSVDLANKVIVMEFIDGLKLKDFLRQKQLANHHVKYWIQKIGAEVLKLHSNNIIHGDLTTSNMIVKEDKLFIIDFGLSYIKNSAEDRAVDLYVLERAFASTHPEIQGFFQESFYTGYKDEQVLKRLDKVRARGRKKLAFG